jgi:hypothetical protein
MLYNRALVGGQMSFLTDVEKESLTINRMIFHVVGKSLDEPILLEEITPPQHTDFFLERVRSALRGNLFEFRDEAATEQILRDIAANPASFTMQSQALARDFQSRHSGSTSMGVFFVFELSIGLETPIYALIKYDNEDVVRYILQDVDGPQVPRLERFQETFVRKPEAMQKIAVVRLNDNAGGQIIVRDRSKPSHISDYFEGFLQARRLNSPEEMSTKLVEALKETLRQHRDTLPEEVQKSGVNRIYEVLHQGGHVFDPDDNEGLLTAIFGRTDEDAPLRRTLKNQLKQRGIEEETFDIEPEVVQKPRRRKLVTAEGTQVIFDAQNRPEIRNLEDGRKEIAIVTRGVTIDDVDTAKDT